MHIENIIKMPLITEKSSAQAEKLGSYGFKVDAKANKNQIKLAIEKFYNVKVVRIRTNITPGKLKRVGKNITKTPKIKKAYVNLAEGQKIEFFKGV